MIRHDRPDQILDVFPEFTYIPGDDSISLVFNYVQEDFEGFEMPSIRFEPSHNTNNLTIDYDSTFLKKKKGY